MKKKKTGRICITLPNEMLEDFQLRSMETGLSISRLIYLRLRNRLPIIIVSDFLVQEVTSVKKMIEDLKKNSSISQEKLKIFERWLEHISKLVDLGSPHEVIQVAKKF